MTDNPYWEAMKGHLQVEERPWGNFPCVGMPNFKAFRDKPKTAETIKEFEDSLRLDRYEYTSKYAWTITDPDSVGFVAAYAGDGLIDPMAGTGYWAYVLWQLGVSVACYDKEPGTNHWHEGQELFVPIMEADCEASVTYHPHLTLFLSWPPMNDAGARALKAYGGNRVIYVGENGGGCTGNDELHDLLENEWVEVARHRCVQWWGMNDYITVYDRKAQ